MDDNHYDDLGGAYYFADDKQSFEPRTPKGTGCGCLFAILIISFAALFSNSAFALKVHEIKNANNTAFVMASDKSPFAMFAVPVNEADAGDLTCEYNILIGDYSRETYHLSKVPNIKFMYYPSGAPILTNDGRYLYINDDTGGISKYDLKSKRVMKVFHDQNSLGPMEISMNGNEIIFYAFVEPPNENTSDEQHRDTIKKAYFFNIKTGILKEILSEYFRAETEIYPEPALWVDKDNVMISTYPDFNNHYFIKVSIRNGEKRTVLKNPYSDALLYGNSVVYKKIKTRNETDSDKFDLYLKSTKDNDAQETVLLENLDSYYDGFCIYNDNIIYTRDRILNTFNIKSKRNKSLNLTADSLACSKYTLIFKNPITEKYYWAIMRDIVGK